MNKHYLVSLVTLVLAFFCVAATVVLLVMNTKYFSHPLVKYVDRVVTMAPATPSAVMQKVPVRSGK